MARLKLSPPWSIFYDEIRALFANDPEVNVVMDEDSYTIHVFVNNPEKSAAIAQILEQEKKFGRITLKVQVPPPDDENVEFASNIAYFFCFSHSKNCWGYSPGSLFLISLLNSFC